MCCHAGRGCVGCRLCRGGPGALVGFSGGSAAASAAAVAATALVAAARAVVQVAMAVVQVALERMHELERECYKRWATRCTGWTFVIL